MLKWDVISKAITCLILSDVTTSTEILEPFKGVMVQKREEEMMQQREGGNMRVRAGILSCCNEHLCCAKNT